MKQVEIGVQTYTYRRFDIAGIVAELKDSAITALELFLSHLSPESTADEVAEARARFSDAGLRVCGVGVCRFSSERPDELRRTIEFAARLGCDYISIDVEPDDAEGKEMLVKAALEAGILLAIHNHGPGHHYESAESVLASCGGYDRVLGACVDTGHFLRVGQSAEHAIEVLGERVHAVHLKDFVDAETEVVPGTGNLSYGAALSALQQRTNFASALVIEYEADPENPTPGVRQSVGVLKQALEGRD